MDIQKMQINDILTAEADIVSLLDSLKNEAASRQERMHLAAVSCLQHANVHGDTGLLARMLDSFSSTENVQEFLYWVHIFGDRRIKYDPETKKFYQANKDRIIKDNVSVDAKREVTYKKVDGSFDKQFLRAINTPWWKLGKVEQERAKPLFDPEKDKKSLVGMIGRHAKMAEESGYPELAEAYRSIEAQMVGAFNAAMSIINKRKAADKVVEVEQEQEEDNTGNQ